MKTLVEAIEILIETLLDEHASCPICHGAGLVDCPRHGEVLDEEGWCAVCDTPMDGGPAEPTNCPCQADTEDELRAMVARIWG